MAEGRQEEAWNHTSHLLAALYNVNRGPKQKPLSPDYFHPFSERTKAAAKGIRKKGSIKMLKDIFIDGKLPERERKRK